MAPVMLVFHGLSCSPKAIDMALEEAMSAKKLVIVATIDKNLATCFLPADVAFCTGGITAFEADLLQHLQQTLKKKIETIAERARTLNLHVVTHLRIGSLGSLCAEIIAQETPSLIVTPRSYIPSGLKWLLHSPADRLRDCALCPVIQA